MGADPVVANARAIPAGADPVVVVRYAALLSQDDPSERDRALDFAAGHLDTLPPPACLQVLQIAEAAGRHDLIAPALAALSQRPDLPHGVAIGLLRRAVMDDQPVAPLVASLSARVTPPQRRLFRIEATALVEGPEAALRLARAPGQVPPRPRPRGRAEAAQLARLLLDCGRAGLARRYLARCLLRWPGESAMPFLFVTACLDGGRAKDAEDWLARHHVALGSRLAEELRIEILALTGRTAEALEQMVEGRGVQRPERLLRAALRLGRTDIAEAQASLIALQHGRGRRGAAHFAVSHLGAMLNEMRLSAVARRSGMEEAALAECYVQPAMAVVDRMAIEGVPAGPGRIPRRIVQYWNTGAAPTEIVALMDGWRNHPDWSHHLYDRAGACAFLMERFGPRHLRAFRLANHVAEECDFLRLCLLLADGGIYADADDKCLTGPDDVARLAGGAGLVLFREPFGAVLNNLIACAPGHPLIARAVEMAVTSLLARENDSTWSKTGPGLVIRALAVHLLDCAEGDTDPDVALLPLSAMRSAVKPHMKLPYKQTGAYWDTRGDPVSAGLREGLARLADPAGDLGSEGPDAA